MTASTCLPPRGLFITGTDTDVGKTYVAALIARDLTAAGHRVGVYKPAASGCRREGDTLVSADAETLWRAAGCPGELQRVCPQRFAAPLAPHLAAAAEGRQLDPQALRDGLTYWQTRCDVILVEGIGGLMCPLGDRQYVADLVYDFGFPLLIVTRNTLGTINHTLQTLITAATFRSGLRVAGIVLNNPARPASDLSLHSNRQELAAHCAAPLLAEVAWQANRFDAAVDWWTLAEPVLGLGS